MPQWKDVLWQAVNKAYYRGGEVKIIFIKRQQKRIPIIESYIDNQVRCDEETVITEED